MAARISRLIGSLVLLVVVGAAVTPAQGGENHYIYLPLALKEEATSLGLWGRVTYEGEAIGGLTLELRYYAAGGVTFPVIANTVTAADGQYVFSGVPALGSGDFYQIYYRNSADDRYIGSMRSHMVTVYAPGDSVHVVDFDVANIPLTSPGAGAAIGFTTFFHWTKRAASPTDSYHFSLYSLAGAPVLSSANYGWTDTFALTSLPPTTSYGQAYLWAIGTYLLPGGDHLESFEQRKVCFGSCPAVAAAPQRPDWHQLLP